MKRMSTAWLAPDLPPASSSSKAIGSDRRPPMGPELQAALKGFREDLRALRGRTIPRLRARVRGRTIP